MVKPRRALRWSGLMAMVLSASLLTGCLASGAESFLDRTNQLRAARQVPALQVNDVLQRKAQRWADTIAARGTLDHSQLTADLDGVAWLSLAENVARGPATGDWALRLQESLVSSSSHLANLVDRRFTHMGVGLSTSGGQVYLVQVFAEIR